MKKVLVIEEPRSCLECPCVDDEAGAKCMAMRREFAKSARIQMASGTPFRPGFCPLQDLPEYKLDWRAGSDGYESGWNDCLDKVTGGRR